MIRLSSRPIVLSLVLVSSTAFAHQLPEISSPETSVKPTDAQCSDFLRNYGVALKELTIGKASIRNEPKVVVGQIEAWNDAYRQWQPFCVDMTVTHPAMLLTETLQGHNVIQMLFKVFGRNSR